MVNEDFFRPSPSALKKAASLSVAYATYQRHIAQLAKESNGESPFEKISVEFVYLGFEGKDEEHISEEEFLSDTNTRQRLPGYYAIGLFWRADGTPIIQRPFIGVQRDPNESRNGERKDNSQDGGWRELMEENRIMREELKRENAKLGQKAEHYQREIESFSIVHQALLSNVTEARMERDRAIFHACEMERNVKLMQQRLKEVEEETDSFSPHIKMLVSHMKEAFGPEAQSMAESFAGFSAAQQAGNDVQAHPVGVEVRPDEPLPEGVIGADALTDQLYQLFWLHEQFGQWVIEQKLPDGRPAATWATVRTLIFYATGMDLGPKAVWPSEVKDVPSSASGQGSASSSRAQAASPSADAPKTEIVSSGDAGDDAIDASILDDVGDKDDGGDDAA